jgi:hypothetical protein
MQIRSRLFIIMISLVTAAIIVPSVIALNTFTRSLEAEITEELKISALNAMDKLSRLMFERLADLRFLTYPNNTIITNSSDNISLGEKVEYLRQIERANKAYASISIYNASGIKLAILGVSILGSMIRENLFSEMPLMVLTIMTVSLPIQGA